ncbi:MAG: hypothetical protein M0P12_03285 [Paludibacteraceae bacterium]|nr:hypothetical protein [Paludibacteraceae bacterium]
MNEVLYKENPALQKIKRYSCDVSCIFVLLLCTCITPFFTIYGIVHHIEKEERRQWPPEFFIQKELPNHRLCLFVCGILTLLYYLFWFCVFNLIKG